MLDNAGTAGSPNAKANILKAFRNAVDGRTGTQPDKSFTAQEAAELKLLSTGL
jgi:hypothetical protein